MVAPRGDRPADESGHGRDSRYDLVIVGMGSGGMVSAEFAATLGLRVAVVERDRVGGDCLWTGCVPSKALLASAKAAHTIRHADRYGLPAAEPEIDLATVWRRIRAVRHEIAHTDDDPHRYEQMGIEIVRGTARVTGPQEVTANGARVLPTRMILLCTGSRPATPAITGLVEAGFITNEDVFELTSPPRSVIIIGGGPVGVEMAQAFARLGIATTLLQRGPRILPRDEAALTSLVEQVLTREGVDLHLDTVVDRVRVGAGHKVVQATVAGRPSRFEAEEVLVATGRTADVEDLGLEEVGIGAGTAGIEVDARGRTAVKSIYAAGDAAGRHRFTHSAGYEGVRAVRDFFFPGRGTADAAISWCTFTDPELAHSGLTVAEAEERHGDDVEVWRLDLEHSDRARTDGARTGAIVLVTAKGRIVGAHLLAPAAGEMIHELALAMDQGLKLSDVASLVHVYPTLSTSIGQLGAQAAFERAHRLRWLVRKAR